MSATRRLRAGIGRFRHGERREEVGGALRDVVYGVGERVTYADDDGVGLVLVNELAPLDGLGGGRA